MEDFICSVCPQSGELPLRRLNSNIIRKAFTPRFKEAGWWGVLQDVSQNICKQYLWHHKYLCRPHKKKSTDASLPPLKRQCQQQSVD